MVKRATLAAVAVSAGLGLAAAGWAAGATTAGGAQSFATERTSVTQLKQDIAKAPAKVPAKGSDHDVDPATAAAFEKVAKASLAELATKLGRTPAQVEAALEKASTQVKPSQSDAIAVKTGTEADRKRVMKGLEQRGILALARELKVDVPTLTKALNEVKNSQLASNEALIKAELAKAVKSGKLSQAEADAALKMLKDEKIGG